MPAKNKVSLISISLHKLEALVKEPQSAAGDQQSITESWKCQMLKLFQPCSPWRLQNLAWAMGGIIINLFVCRHVYEFNF